MVPPFITGTGPSLTGPAASVIVSAVEASSTGTESVAEAEAADEAVTESEAAGVDLAAIEVDAGLAAAAGLVFLAFSCFAKSQCFSASFCTSAIDGGESNRGVARRRKPKKASTNRKSPPSPDALNCLYRVWKWASLDEGEVMATACFKRSIEAQMDLERKSQPRTLVMKLWTNSLGLAAKTEDVALVCCAESSLIPGLRLRPMLILRLRPRLRSRLRSRPKLTEK